MLATYHREILSTLGALCLTLPAQARSDQTTIGRRTSGWAAEEQAREQTLVEVRHLLRSPLTTASAVRIALLNNRGLRATFADIGLAQADLLESRTVPNPRLDVSARFPDKPPSGTDVEWSIAQNFLNILMIPLKTKIARDQLLAVQLRVSAAVRELVAATKAAVYELQAAEETLNRLTLEKATQSASLNFIQDLHEAGNVTDLRLLQQQAEYGQARLEIAQVEADVQTLREKLNRLMGLWGGDTNWKLEPHVPDAPREDLQIHGLETLAITQRPDLAAARTDLESAVKAAGLEKNFRWLGALDFGIDSERQSDGQTITGPTLSLELPIFNQGQARIARVNAAVRKAYDRLEEQAIDIRSEVREQRDKLNTIRATVEYYRDDLIPFRRQIRDQFQLQYNAMVASPVELFTARQQEIAAERAYIEAKRDYWVTRSELEKTVGGSLTRVPATVPGKD